MSNEQSPLLEMTNISKSFGKIQALRNVTFALNRKEVVGLVGDNGAGKSTLVKILSGVHSPDQGEIYLEGKKVKFSSPADARAAGIETVYQDIGLVNRMSIYRNFFLGREETRTIGFLPLLDLRSMQEKSKKALDSLGIRIRSVTEDISFLSGGERQSISVARSTFFGGKILILDEPTMALSVRESKRILELVAHARDRGVSIIFITHNVYQVHEVADRLVVLERGQKIADLLKKDSTPGQIIEIIATGKVERLK